MSVQNGSEEDREETTEQRLERLMRSVTLDGTIDASLLSWDRHFLITVDWNKPHSLPPEHRYDTVCPICKQGFDGTPYKSAKSKMWQHCIDAHPDQIEVRIKEPNEARYYLDNESTV